MRQRRWLRSVGVAPSGAAIIERAAQADTPWLVIEAPAQRHGSARAHLRTLHGRVVPQQGRMPRFRPARLKRERTAVDIANARPCPMSTSACRTTKRIERALPSLAAWVSHFRSAPIPVLASTAADVRELAANEDAVDAHMLAALIGEDPLMTLKLLSHIGTSSRRETDVETVVGGLVLMGIGPFFRRFGDLATIDEALGDSPDSDAARAGLHAVLSRAHRAARFALGFAAHRLDPDAAVIHEAALLHDFAELLLWCHAPTLALETARRQEADPTLRSAAVQRAVLGIELADLQQALMKVWRLPELLVKLGDNRHVEQVQVKNVLLAVRLARHTARGWDNPALPDDIAEIGALLLLGPVPTLALLRDIDSD